MSEDQRKGDGTLSEAAATLGSHGGKARAAVLSTEQKKAIASKGGKAQKKGTAWQRGGKARGAARKRS